MATSTCTSQSALDDVTTAERCLIVLPSNDLLAELIAHCWRRDATFALLKPTIAPEYLHAIVAAYDPAVIISCDGGDIRITRRPHGGHPRPVIDRSLTVFTSGTTGPPKGVVLPREAVVGNAAKTAALHGLTEGHAHGTCLELFHVNALVMSLIGSLETGVELVRDHSGDPASYFALLDQQGARTASVHPVALSRIVDRRPRWPEQLEYLITAAGPCSRRLAGAFYAAYGPRLVQGYGMSEAVNFSFVMPQLDSAEFVEHYMRGRPPVGVALPDTEFTIDSGELYIKTPDRMLGYLGLAQPTPIDGNGWLRTGDYAVMRDGFVVLGGRTVDAVRTASTAIAPALVEDRLALPDAVGEYAVADLSNLGAKHPALFTAGPWHPALTSLTERSQAAGLDYVNAGELSLSPSGKPQRGAMSGQAAAVLAALEGLLERSAAQDVPGRLNDMLAALRLSSTHLVEEPALTSCNCRRFSAHTALAIVTTGDCQCVTELFNSADFHEITIAIDQPSSRAYALVSAWNVLAPARAVWARRHQPRQALLLHATKTLRR